MKGWLYSVDEPSGAILEGEVYTNALENGWVDTPAKLVKEHKEEEPTLKDVIPPKLGRGKYPRKAHYEHR